MTHVQRCALITAALLPLAACASGGTAAPAAEPVAQEQAAGGMRLLNERAAISRIRSTYPQLLWDAGVTGWVDVEVRLNGDGSVVLATLVTSTHEAFSGPAVSVARMLRFTEPELLAQRVRVRVNYTKPEGSVQVINR